jgi:hypothetical protein
MLIGLEKLSIEVGLSESELLNLVTYSGLPRARGGFYDDREVLTMLVRHFREEIFGCAAGDYAEPGMRVRKCSRPQVARFLSSSPKRRKSPGAGNLISR